MGLVDQIIFQSALVKVGLFRCDPVHPHFSFTPIESGHPIVFPRTSVGITDLHGEQVVADPTVVMLYNFGQGYRRQKLSDLGDRCEWFTFHPRVLVEALRRYDRDAEKRVERPFTFRYAPSDPRSYLFQRLVVEHILSTDTPDALFIEEMLLHVLHRVVAQANAAHGVSPAATSRSTQQAHAALAQEAKAILAERFRERVTLDELAAQLYTSPYHLCRVFREQSGYTVNRYLHQLRLRTALESIMEGAPSLNEVAAELGYASHSHFTGAFRRTFKVLPSAVKRAHAATLLEQARRTLVA